jgi:hypothetical protein
MAKRKVLGLKKRPRRTLPRQSSDSGVNPLAVAAGAAAGYKAGSVISNRKRDTKARRSVTSDYESNLAGRLRSDDPWAMGLTNKSAPRFSNTDRDAAAIYAYAKAGDKLPSVSQTKLNKRRATADALYDQYASKNKGGIPRNGQYEAMGKKASKAAGMTRAEEKLLQSRKAIARKARQARSSGDILDAATARTRLASGTVGASRRSRVGGALSGAAITAIAQLVAAELRKKR